MHYKCGRRNFVVKINNSGIYIEPEAQEII